MAAQTKRSGSATTKRKGPSDRTTSGDTAAKRPKKRKRERTAQDAPSAGLDVPANAVELAAEGAGERRTLASQLRVPSGLRRLDEISTQPGDFGPQSKQEAAADMHDMGDELASLQEKLFAESVVGGRRSVLVLLQGMDTAGKDGVIKHVLGQLNPGSVRITSFKKPTEEELAHDFLWRIEKGVPRAGEIGVFNRSQYEDVLVVRVHDLVPRSEWSRRFVRINEFERRLARGGVTLVKCFLHVSKQTQKERLLARLDDPTKYWKFNPADVDERAYWDDYQTAYADVLRRCSTVAAPWFVIPSDKKWYRNWAVAALLHETLVGLDPHHPPADYDIAEQRLRLERD